MKEVQKSPSYDKFNGEFKDKRKKHNAWNRVGDLFSLSANQADDKSKSIRTYCGR